MSEKVLIESFKKSLPVMAGYVLLGIGFGVLLRDAGYGVLWAFSMCALIYAGAMQYVGVGLLASGASIINVIITSLVVNARHLFYSISVMEEYAGAGKKKPYLIFALTDETYSLVCDGTYPNDVDKHTYRFYVSLFNQCYWIIGGIIGNVLGDVVPFDTSGIDFSMTALFVAAFVSQWKNSKDHFPAIVGVICSVICLLIFGADIFLIPSMLIITFFLIVFRRKKNEDEGKETNL